MSNIQRKLTAFATALSMSVAHFPAMALNANSFANDDLKRSAVLAYGRYDSLASFDAQEEKKDKLEALLGTINNCPSYPTFCPLSLKYTILFFAGNNFENLNLNQHQTKTWVNGGTINDSSVILNLLGKINSNHYMHMLDSIAKSSYPQGEILKRLPNVTNETVEALSLVEKNTTGKLQLLRPYDTWSTKQFDLITLIANGNLSAAQLDSIGSIINGSHPATGASIISGFVNDEFGQKFYTTIFSSFLSAIGNFINNNTFGLFYPAITWLKYMYNSAVGLFNGSGSINDVLDIADKPKKKGLREIGNTMNTGLMLDSLYKNTGGTSTGQYFASWQALNDVGVRPPGNETSNHSNQTSGWNNNTFANTTSPMRFSLYTFGLSYASGLKNWLFIKDDDFEKQFFSEIDEVANTMTSSLYKSTVGSIYGLYFTSGEALNDAGVRLPGNETSNHSNQTAEWNNNTFVNNDEFQDEINKKIVDLISAAIGHLHNLRSSAAILAEQSFNETSKFATPALSHLGQFFKNSRDSIADYYVSYQVSNTLMKFGILPYVNALFYKYSFNMIRLAYDFNPTFLIKNGYNLCADQYANVFGTAAGNTTSFVSLGKGAWTTVGTEVGRQYMFNKSHVAATRYSQAFQQKNLFSTFSGDFNQGFQNIVEMPKSFHSPDGLWLLGGALTLTGAYAAMMLPGAQVAAAGLRWLGPELGMLTSGTRLQLFTDFSTKDFGETNASSDALKYFKQALKETSQEIAYHTILGIVARFITWLMVTPANPRREHVPLRQENLVKLTIRAGLLETTHLVLSPLWLQPMNFGAVPYRALDAIFRSGHRLLYPAAGGLQSAGAVGYNNPPVNRGNVVAHETILSQNPKGAVSNPSVTSSTADYTTPKKAPDATKVAAAMTAAQTKINSLTNLAKKACFASFDLSELSIDALYKIAKEKYVSRSPDWISDFLKDLQDSSTTPVDNGNGGNPYTPPPQKKNCLIS